MHTALSWSELDDRAVATARVLAADAVEKVGNGHPGTAISLAPIAYTLFSRLLRYDVADDRWAGRDRFVLSCGHSALTQYVQLFLAGLDMELNDLQALRTWGAKTPGHPEFRHTKFVETTTGPLGQGIATAVGMAMDARRVRGLLDPEAPVGTSPFDHRVVVIASDGDLQEGVSAEASSLAGTQELGNLLVIWDDNHISIEDDTDIAFTEDVDARYRAYGWHVQRVDFTASGSYVEDLDALWAAIEAAQAETGRPSLISVRTIIGWPAPTKQNTGAIHGSKLGGEELAALKELLGFDPQSHFAVAEEVLTYTRQNAARRSQQLRSEWDERYTAWRAAHPEAAALYDRLAARQLPSAWDANLPEFGTGTPIATRAASGKVLAALAESLPELWGGSADLAGSNNTTMPGQPSFLPAHRSTAAFAGHEYGRTLHFGIREHAMGAILNGMAAQGLTRPYGGTFFQFADYMRPAVRLAALMDVPSIFVWTHDSIGVGEDGPTHQPVEHLAAMRAIPNFAVVRPADAAETSVAWREIIARDKPAGLVLSRQNLPDPARGGELASAQGVARGAYILAEAPAGLELQVLLIATGSEVSLALAARSELAQQGIGARVVSMPCQEWFDAQDATYRDEVLPPSVRARVAMEAGIAMPWHRYVGQAGRIVSLEHFGASAAAEILFEQFGFTPQAVVAAAHESLSAL
ncbi:transketolase [Buchananella hordeovulneris]|uniref:transketolase n=1 Tax=Buchananella hordeovulneris TaxID=52770 RepID=UPI0026DD0E2D|nr:transketolase [Buchananella hordeovulneris]MDO5079735.1 transketolase [Buchananella hordeovulneris]